jgi:tetratricopeptide (TPR) repeat protein
MSRALSCLALLCLLAGRAGAQAPDEKTEKARIHVRAAIAYYDEGRYEDAAREMQVAYDLKPVPDLQYNLAQCYERLNKLDEAAGAYEKYLAGRPDALDAKQVKARIENLRERARAEAEGKETPPAPPVEKVVFKTIVVYKEKPPKPGRAARGAAYGLGVLGLGSLAAGIACAVLAKQAADQVTTGGDPAMPADFRDLVATQEAGKTYPIISGVTFALGGLALGGAVALYLVGNKIDREQPKVTWAPSFGPGGGGLLVKGRF